MHGQPFPNSVLVATDEGARCRVVSDTLHAAEVLLRRWPPARRGRHYRIAVTACLEAMNGLTAAAAARRAFAAAARHARILVQGPLRKRAMMAGDRNA